VGLREPRVNGFRWRKRIEINERRGGAQARTRAPQVGYAAGFNTVSMTDRRILT